jgi:hypothetical protein
MKKTNLLLCAALCASITLSACGDDPVPSSNNATPDMTVTPDMPVTPTDMNTTPDQSVTSDMDTTPDMNRPDMNMPDANMPDMNTPGGLTADNFGVKFAEALCAKAESCCTPEEYMDNFSGAGCVAETGAVYAQFLPTGEDIASGRLDFDATAAQAIINMFNTISCADINMTQDVDLPYVGKVAEGGVCESDLECAEPAGKTALCADTCIVLKDRGEACTDTLDCEFDSYCGPAGTCAAPLPAGSDCADDYDCLSSLCGMAVEGKCDELLALGDDCFEDRECESGFCDFDTEVCVASAPEQLFCAGLF